MEFEDSNDPFSQSDPVYSPEYTPPVFSEGPQSADLELVAEQPASPEIDPEETARQEQRDLENKERQKRLQRKDEKEQDQKNLKRQEARQELGKWYEDRNKLILQAKEMNKTKETELLNSKSQFNDNSSWKKVASMIDFKENADRKDQARMRAVLLAKKHESK